MPGRPDDRAVLLGVVLVAAALKLHYSMASADELVWVLGPTTALVSAALGVPFPFESGAGYLSTELGVLIAKSCAGVNFLTVAFLSGAFGLMPLRERRGGAAIFAAGTLMAAYGLTIYVNAIRILLGVWLRQAAVTPEWLGGATAHRMQGAFLYMVALGAVFLLARQRVLVRSGHAGAA